MTLRALAGAHAITGTPRESSTGEMIAFARICAHYFRYGAWLDEAVLVRDAARLGDVPAVLIHGRRDLTCPVETAYLLARAWPGARLLVLDDAGHLASNSKRRALIDTFDAFTSQHELA